MKSYDGQLLLPFDFPEEVYIRDTSTMTDPVFVSREKQINSFIRSGEQLQSVRREEFEYPDGDVPDDVRPDPTMQLGFDFSDYSREMYLLKSRQAAHAARAVEGAGETEESVPGDPSSAEKDS